jgi:hypothetical protein
MKQASGKYFLLPSAFHTAKKDFPRPTIHNPNFPTRLLSHVSGLSSETVFRHPYNPPSTVSTILHIPYIPSSYKTTLKNSSDQQIYGRNNKPAHIWYLNLEDNVDYA